jgi:hypothetical protein
MVEQTGVDPSGSPAFVGWYDGRLSYRSAGFFMYLAERFGDRDLTTLEHRSAEFFRRLYSGDSGWESARDAMGASKSGAVADALRDFYVAWAVHGAANYALLPDRFKILDETTIHGAMPPGETIVEGQRWPPLKKDDPQPSPIDLDQPAGTARIVSVTVPAGASAALIEIVQLEPHEEGVRVGLLPSVGVAGGLAYAVDSQAMVSGPALGGPQTFPVDVDGRDRLDIVAVAGQAPQRNRVSVSFLSGTRTMTIGAMAPVAAGGQLVAPVALLEDGRPLRIARPGGFTATIDDVPVVIESTHGGERSQALVIRTPASLLAGTHMLRVSYGSPSGGPVSASRAFTIQAIPAPGPRLAVLDASGTTAGLPLTAAVAVIGDTGSLPGADVTVTVTDPLGAVRTFPMGDSGSIADGGAGDGAYAAEILGTQAPGTYALHIAASGTNAAGQPFTATADTEVSLAPGTDTDADGVADELEASLGLNPAQPADGETDLDLDGAGTATELAAGSSPVGADTDGGGEADGSELGRGADPRDPADDLVQPPGLAIRALDGRRIELHYAGQAGETLELTRVALDGSRVPLGTATGDGTITDGPLPVGSYRYEAVARVTGATSAAAAAGPLAVRDDVTPPTGRLELARDAARTNTTHLAVAFIDVAGAPAQMRLALAEGDLAAAAWIPYAAATTIDVPATGGFHAVYAQLRDGAGNESGVIADTVELDRVVPVSAAGPLDPVTMATWVSVTCTATDDDAVAFVSVWRRYRLWTTDPWGPWIRAETRYACPFTVGLDEGDGYYEIATTAADWAGNVEPLPATGDAAVHRGPIVEPLANPLGTAQNQARVALGRDDVVRAVWRDRRNSSSITDIYYARRTAASGTWSAAERVDDAAVAASVPDVAADSSGNVYVVWVDARRGDPDIWFAKRSASTGTWSAGVRVNDDAAGSVQASPSITVAPDGVATAVWVDRRGGKVNLYSARLAAGASAWAANVRVTADQTNDKAEPYLAVDGTGRVFLVWRQAKSAKWGAWFSSLPAGSGTWAAAERLSGQNANVTYARIAADDAGRLVAGYEESAATLWLHDRPAGGTWSAGTTIANNAAHSLAVAFQRTGRAYAAYVEGAVINRLAFDPVARTWTAPVAVTSSGVHAGLGEACTATTCVIVANDGTGTGGDVMAYPVGAP